MHAITYLRVRLGLVDPVETREDDPPAGYASPEAAVTHGDAGDGHGHTHTVTGEDGHTHTMGDLDGAAVGTDAEAGP